MTDRDAANLRDISNAVIQKGFYAIEESLCDHTECRHLRIVVVQRRLPSGRGYGGRSLWVTLLDDCYVITLWTGAAYTSCNSSDIKKVLFEFLGSEGDSYSLPDELSVRYQLSRNDEVLSKHYESCPGGAQHLTHDTDEE